MTRNATHCKFNVVAVKENNDKFCPTFPHRCKSTYVHLQHILVSAVVLKDESDCGDMCCTEHWPQAVQGYVKVLLSTQKVE